jgi:hypothetical protein
MRDHPWLSFVVALRHLHPAEPKTDVSDVAHGEVGKPTTENRQPRAESACSLFRPRGNLI